MSLTTKILLAMLAGFVVGIALYFTGQSAIAEQVLGTLGSIFVSLLKVLVVPIVVVSLVCGVCSLGDDNARLGPIAAKTLALYLLTTAIAISLALGAALIIKPGAGIDKTTDTEFVAKEAPPLSEVILNIIPTNPIKAMAEGNMLQIIVFSLLFGLAISKTPGVHGQRIREVFESLNEVVLAMVTIIMKLAPIGVFCLTAALFAKIGFSILGGLAKYFLTVVGVLLVHGCLTYGALLAFVGRLSPVRFFMKMRPVQLFAFSTASSNATIPINLSLVRKRLGVKNKVASFTVPLGATLNMDGTAIMQGVATAFIAQAYGIELTVNDFLAVIATATLASIGTAGVPGVGLVLLAVVLQQVGLPVEGIALIIGVDRLLDMLRTAVNVTGDAAVSCVVARSEKALDHELYDTPLSELLLQEQAEATQAKTSG